MPTSSLLVYNKGVGITTPLPRDKFPTKTNDAQEKMILPGSIATTQEKSSAFVDTEFPTIQI